MGGDRYAGDDDGSSILAASKVWRCGPLVCGGCGDFADDSVFRETVRAFVRRRRRITARDITEKLPTALRKAFTGVGDREQSQWLIAMGASIYEVSGLYGVIELQPGIVGIGCGGVAAVAAAIALSRVTERSTPAVVVRRALEATSLAYPRVRGPFDVESTGGADVSST
jgi:hypothetical protein